MEPESEEAQTAATLPPLLKPEVIQAASTANDKTSSRRLEKLLAVRESMRAAREAGVEERDGVHVKPEEAERRAKRVKRAGALTNASAAAMASAEVEAKGTKKELEDEDDFFGGDDDDDE